MLPEKVAEVREWVEKAAEDLGVAEYIGRPTHQEAVEALGLAREVFAFVLGHLPQEVRP